MQIKVTQRNINQGVRKSATCCPIANALKDAGFYGVNVGESIVYANSNKYILTPGSSAFVKAFDAGDEVHPTTVTME